MALCTWAYRTGWSVCASDGSPCHRQQHWVAVDHIPSDELTSKSTDGKIVFALRKHRDLAQVLRHFLLGLLSLLSPPWAIPTFWLLAHPPPAHPFHFLEVSSALCTPSLSWMQFALYFITVLRRAHMQDHCCLWELRWGWASLLTLTLLSFLCCFLPASAQAYGTPLPSQSLCWAPLPGVWTLPQLMSLCSRCALSGNFALSLFVSL